MYEYECRECGVFPAFRSMEERHLPALCVRCEQLAARIISAPNLSLMSPLQRVAATRNERSRHQPLVANRGACCSGATCSHRRPPEAKTKDGKPALRASRKKNRRPWMLGH
jgi:putative FmdB family regulatory protein